MPKTSPALDKSKVVQFVDGQELPIGTQYWKQTKPIKYSLVKRRSISSIPTQSSYRYSHQLISSIDVDVYRAVGGDVENHVRKYYITFRGSHQVTKDALGIEVVDDCDDRKKDSQSSTTNICAEGKDETEAILMFIKMIVNDETYCRRIYHGENV